MAVLRVSKRFSIVLTAFTFVVIPMTIGFLIYFLSRPHSIHFLHWIDNTFGLSQINQINLPYWVVYHLPDGIWSFSLTSVLFIIWGNRISKKNILWLITPTIIAIFFEIFIGTFDSYDLYSVLIGGLIPILFNLVTNFKFNKYEKQTQI